MANERAIDFVKLSSAAHPDRERHGPREAMDALWTALFELPEWIFAVFPEDPLHPYMSTYQGHRWLFAFTDTVQLDRFLEENSLNPKDGERVFMTMPVDGARQYIAEMGDKGTIYGVQFNFGGPGWFAPYENVERIHAHLFG